MKHLLIFGLFIFSSPFSIAKSNFGLGIVIGDPTGITAKYILNKSESLDAAFAYDDDELYLHGTYLKIIDKLFTVDKYNVPWYIGGGVRIIDHDKRHNHKDEDDDGDTHLGGRAPVGLLINFKKIRVQAFAELSLAMDIVPETDFDLDFGIGARYFF